jgi:hypothetical protein
MGFAMNNQNQILLRAACLAAAIAVVIGVCGQLSAAQKPPAAVHEDDFDLTKEAKGKILYLSLKHADEATGESYTVFLVDARTAHMGGKTLIVGKGYAAEDEEDAWYKDMTIGVAWDSVMAFHIMTEKQYEEFIAEPAEDDRQAARQRRVR